MNRKVQTNEDTSGGVIAPQNAFRNVSKRFPERKANLLFAKFFATIGLSESSPRMRAHAMPVGEFFDWRYGKIIFSLDYLTQAKANAEKWQGRGAILPLNFDHDPTRPAGRIQIITLEGNRLWIEAELLPNAEEALRRGEYARFSPEWMDMFQDEKGEKYGPMLLGGALTNIPLFATSLDGIYLLEDEKLLKVAAREYAGTQKISKEQKNEMDSEKLKELTGSEDPEEQLAKISEWKEKAEAKPAEPEPPKEPAGQAKEEEGEEKAAAAEDGGKKEAAALRSELAATSAKVVRLEAEAKKKARADLLEKAYREGKIDFDQKTKWAEAEKCEAFPTNESLAAFLKTARKVVPDPKGFESAEPLDEELSENDKKSAARLNMSEDQWRRYQKGEIKKKEAK